MGWGRGKKQKKGKTREKERKEKKRKGRRGRLGDMYVCRYSMYVQYSTIIVEYCSGRVKGNAYNTHENTHIDITLHMIL